MLKVAAKTARKKLLYIVLLAIVGVSLLVVSGIGLYDYLKVTQTGEVIPGVAVVETTEVVSEKDPGPVIDSFTVPASHPRQLSIEKLGVSAYIQPVGVTKDNEMATPGNLYFAGWYAKNVAPGEKGLSIINGHVGGRYSSGVFKHLKSLGTDDEIRIQMGDLSWRTFKVVSSKAYDVKDASAALFTRTDGIEEELHLITCDGQFDDASQTYDQRLIVVAKYVDSL